MIKEQDDQAPCKTEWRLQEHPRRGIAGNTEVVIEFAVVRFLRSKDRRRPSGFLQRGARTKIVGAGVRMIGKLQNQERGDVLALR